MEDAQHNAEPHLPDPGVDEVTTVHLVYPAGPSIACPDAIGRNVAGRLGRRWRVVHHEWDDIEAIRPGPGSVLLGHPHPAPWTVFRMSARLPGWTRIVVLCPFACGTMWQVSYLDGPVRRADRYLAITGPYWARRIAASPFAHWAPKTEPVDLAVSLHDFPRVKGAFAPAGRRKLLYVGNTASPKNVGYLSAIAQAMPEVEISWAGRGEPIAAVRPLGQLDFSTEEGRRVAAAHDFLLTVGNSDANPATILEAMAWGLVPVCTPQSGYEEEPGIVNVPLGNVAGAVRILRALQVAPAAELDTRRAAADAQLRTRFTWDRFTAQVESAVASPGRGPSAPLPWPRRAGLLAASARAPSSPLRPGNALGLLRTNLVRRAALLRSRGGAA